jgi:hypothetical protein
MRMLDTADDETTGSRALEGMDVGGDVAVLHDKLDTSIRLSSS